MDFLSLLIFDLDGARFGLDATKVRESVWLPELTPLEEAPLWVVGIFSLRGQIVPVTDLHVRFGHPARSYTPNDQVVVLETAHLPMGLIVSEVIGVVELPGTAIQPPPQFESVANSSSHLVAGEVRVSDDLVTLLDASRLTQLLDASMFSGANECPVPSSHFCPQATPEARAVFHARAMALREISIEEDATRLGLAVIELGGECFGIELAAIQEFCDIVQLSPIPCCPPHILGAMNLRGDLLTLIDPRAALNLPSAARGGKAVVALLGDQAMGLAVDAVHNVIYLKQEELQLPPAILRERGGAEIAGTAPYSGRMMTVLNLPALLAREDWIVNEGV